MPSIGGTVGSSLPSAVVSVRPWRPRADREHVGTSDRARRQFDALDVALTPIGRRDTARQASGSHAGSADQHGTAAGGRTSLGGLSSSPRRRREFQGLLFSPFRRPHVVSPRPSSRIPRTHLAEILDAVEGMTPGAERLLISSHTYLEACLRNRGVRALLLKHARNGRSLMRYGPGTGQCGLLQSRFQAMGWPDPTRAHLWVGLVAEAALRAGRGRRRLRTSHSRALHRLTESCRLGTSAAVRCAGSWRPPFLTRLGEASWLAPKEMSQGRHR